MKKITVEKVILFLAASFAAYNFGLAGGYIERTQFSAGGLVAGVVVNVSLAIAASRYGSLKGDKRTKQAQVAFVTMMVFSPVLVSPVVFYSLPETFLTIPLRWAWALAWPMVADLAIVLAGAVSGKGLIALSEPSATHSPKSAIAGATHSAKVQLQSAKSATESGAVQRTYPMQCSHCKPKPLAVGLFANVEQERER